MDERERLVEILGQVQWNAKAEQVADALLKAGVTLPAPRPVWPGLKGEGLEEVIRVFDEANKLAFDRGGNADDARRAGDTATAAHLFRALVAGLPSWKEDERFVMLSDGYRIPRLMLAALADPYDGGGK